MLRLALGFLALLFTVTLASAKEDSAKERKPSKQTMEKHDANKDGTLDDTEKAAAKAEKKAAKDAKKVEKK